MAAMSALVTASATPSPIAAPRSRNPGELAGSAAEDLVLIVAPCNGRFQPEVRRGAVDAGAVVARITTARQSEEVRIPAAATVEGLLSLPGQLVTPGQALAWARVRDGGAV